MNRRVSFSPDDFAADDLPSPPPPPPPPLYFTTYATSKPVTPIGIWTFRSPKKRPSATFSAMRFLDRIKAKFARALGFVSSSSTKSSSNSSCNCSNLKRSRSYVEALDSHRAQAVEDCIQFLHSSSSSSFQRSKSISSCSY